MFRIEKISWDVSVSFLSHSSNMYSEWVWQIVFLHRKCHRQIMFQFDFDNRRIVLLYRKSGIYRSNAQVQNSHNWTWELNENTLMSTRKFEVRPWLFLAGLRTKFRRTKDVTRSRNLRKSLRCSRSLHVEKIRRQRNTDEKSSLHRCLGKWN